MTNIPTAKGEDIRIYFLDENGKPTQEMGTSRLAGGTVNNKVGDILNNSDTYFSYIGQDGMENLINKSDIISVIPTNVKPKIDMKLNEVGISLKINQIKERVEGLINIGAGTLQQILEKKMFLPLVLYKKDSNETSLILINKIHISGKITTIRI